jgi:RNA polymerase sigma-70 factor (sigma-E family)
VTDDRDFSVFVDANARRLQQLAWVLTGDWASAQDLVQATLEKCWPRWSRISTHPSPEGYVRQVMMSVFFRWRRRRWVGEFPHAELPERAADDVFAAVELRNAIAEALLSLPPRQRAVIALRYYEDLSEEQTAHVLGCSTGTVKSQSSRAMAKLRLMPALATFLAEGVTL